MQTLTELLIHHIKTVVSTASIQINPEGSMPGFRGTNISWIESNDYQRRRVIIDISPLGIISLYINGRNYDYNPADPAFRITDITDKITEPWPRAS